MKSILHYQILSYIGKPIWRIIFQAIILVNFVSFYKFRETIVYCGVNRFHEIFYVAVNFFHADSTKWNYTKVPWNQSELISRNIFLHCTAFREMAIFGDASLIISIAASEVDLEAGD